MNRLFVTSALLLGSLSALGLSTSSNEIKSFEISDAKCASLEVLRAEGQDQTPQEKPITINKTTDPFIYNPSKESGNLADNVSKALVQTKKGAKKDTTDIRFVAAVRIGLSDKDGDNKAEIDDGGQFGFHIKYDVDPNNDPSVNDIVNVYAETDKYYSSIVGGGTRYIANDFTTKTGLKMIKWTEENLGDANNSNGYNAFITMELRNVPNAYSSFIEAQPYFVGEKDETATKKVSSVTKKADTLGVEYASIKVDGVEHKMDVEVLRDHARIYFTVPNDWKGISKVMIEGKEATKINDYAWSRDIPLSEAKNTVDIDFEQGISRFHATDVVKTDTSHDTNVDSNIKMDIEPGVAYRVNLTAFAGENEKNSDDTVDKWFNCTNSKAGYPVGKNERFFKVNLTKGQKVEIVDSNGGLVKNYQRGNNNEKNPNEVNGLYTAPLDGEYAFYYKSNTKISNVSVWVSEPTTHHEYLYLKPNSYWKEANARFAMHIFGDSKQGAQWVDMEDVGNGIYRAKVPAGEWTTVIFCRMNPSKLDNNWDNKWEQTNDLNINTSNQFTIKEGQKDKPEGLWEIYDSITPIE